MLEIVASIVIGAGIGFALSVWHLENRIEFYEKKAEEAQKRADRAVDRLLTHLAGAAPVSGEAAEQSEQARSVQMIEAHELRNLFADEIGNEDEESPIPLLPERDPRGRHVRSLGS